MGPRSSIRPGWSSQGGHPGGTGIMQCSRAFSGRQVGTVLAALVALAVVPVGAHAASTTLTVHARRAPYNVSAWASATTNGDGIRKAIADVAAAGGGTVVLPL